MVTTANLPTAVGFQLNTAPAGFNPKRDLAPGLYEFLETLHHEFTPRQQKLVAKRKRVLEASHRAELPEHMQPSEATQGNWRIELPKWCEDQRNQMTGPADEAELVGKMLNSGAPGVMLDLEDSTVNQWDHQQLGMKNVLSALHGELTYYDQKRGKEVAIKESNVVIWTRARGMHLNQAGVMPEVMSASLFDVGSLAYQVDTSKVKHNLCIYIPKSESAEEALWWRDLFEKIEDLRGWPKGYIKCMALVESHPLAYQMEEFLYNLRDHILGLNLGRWDYMASLIHFNLEDPEFVLPDRNAIPHDVLFFQNLRELIPEICHKRGALAIGGMTALYPSREDAELNARALDVLAKDKKNEANSLMDGAWTGHPDQNQIAVDQFPKPNQLHARRANAQRYPDLRPAPKGVGKRTLNGTRAAVRTVIRYRNGVLNGKGASLLDGYMEDLATDRIYRLMIAQRRKHSTVVPITDDDGHSVEHTAELVTRLFDEELEKLIAKPGKDLGSPETFREARRIAEAMVKNGEFDPF
ncbi:Malate synthase [Candidatus Koribacter versatilis Ellin345]|uniref:malate synthase n=1 Tax=Koribacter versatilis (strain Ellin345) TaxID=204669 RepID=Q1IHE3_KORVE|nr:malate synthase [Candidatus Koribacter versatilis]ABF43707.1 Malate synthase [Candidatus Koribacter versatilis Ellin345]